MNTQRHTPVTETSARLTLRVVAGMLIAGLLAPLALAAGAYDDYQRNALFNPGQSQLQAEARGRVMIYDGLENSVVEQALDTQFERIEHMMFTRIPRAESDDDEQVIVEDDGC
jgi:hypothetical protein